MKYLLSLLWLFVGVAAADVPLPDTPAGKILGDFLAAFNSGEAAQVDAFNSRHGRAADPSQWLLDHRSMPGELTLLRVLESEPLKIVVLVQEQETERPLRIELTAKGGDTPVMDQLANRDRNISNTLETQFRLGSQN